MQLIRGHGKALEKFAVGRLSHDDLQDGCFFRTRLAEFLRSVR
jgi:hypothetical protein